ncbi:MAG: adenylosuccinate synthase [Planctomycetes bacterium RBG_16_43_13]|nr:MAG: adenylosuccinate synthase [Planctomycetes bacterium RBG_16_43_13]
MSVKCVVGVQWGDEGKGKIVDIISKDADLVVRFQGGPNAGHTVVVGNDKFVLHHIPSGILHKGTTCVIGNGTVIEPVGLLKEIDDLRSRGVKIDKNLLISERAHLIMPYHKLLDVLSEESSGAKIGTTQQGVGPCYSDKISRKGIRMTDLCNEECFRATLTHMLEEKNKILTSVYGQQPLYVGKIFDEYVSYAKHLRPFVTDTTELINRAIDKGKNVLFEGAQGTMLDIDLGTYPYVTSSNADACGISAGSGVPPAKIGNVIGIAKAYITRVGGGPFPTELTGEFGDALREKGKEYGSTTGRPRRCGWFDGIVARYAVMINAINTFAITKLDVLSGLDEIKFCTAYRLNGKIISKIPSDATELAQCQPVYRNFKGWNEDISAIRKYSDLPVNAKKFLQFIEDFTGVKIKIISVGSERGATILRK